MAKGLLVSEWEIALTRNLIDQVIFINGFRIEIFSILHNFDLNIFLKNDIVDNPSPDSYRLNSSFDFNASSSVMKSKAFTFGMSRDAFNKVYIPS